MWARKTESQLLPWALQGVELGADTLEIGPGYGGTFGC
ncbi:methyltransferase [Mycobacteroides abscessus]|nr:methyltransferase [Mycobacteroides abscessus]